MTEVDNLRAAPRFPNLSRPSGTKAPVASPSSRSLKSKSAVGELRRDVTASRATGYDVLILDAAFRQSLASVRSVGRLGCG